MDIRDGWPERERESQETPIGQRDLMMMRWNRSDLSDTSLLYKEIIKIVMKRTKLCVRTSQSLFFAHS